MPTPAEMDYRQLVIAYAVCNNQIAKLIIEKKELEEEFKNRLKVEMERNVAR